MCAHFTYLCAYASKYLCVSLLMYTACMCAQCMVHLSNSASDLVVSLYIPAHTNKPQKPTNVISPYNSPDQVLVIWALSHTQTLCKHQTNTNMYITTAYAITQQRVQIFIHRMIPLYSIPQTFPVSMPFLPT